LVDRRGDLAQRDGLEAVLGDEFARGCEGALANLLAFAGSTIGRGHGR